MSRNIKVGAVYKYHNKPVRVISEPCVLGNDLYYVEPIGRGFVFVVHADTLQRLRPWEESMYLIGEDELCGN